MNITLDDTSPQFQYISETAGWSQNHTADDQISSYYKETFYGTHTDGDSVSLTFNGTAITIYGAQRSNHGVYSAQLDGGSTTLQLGYSATAKFQQVLYAASGLSDDEEHTIILTNLPSETSTNGNGTYVWWLDIDYAVITTSTSGKIYTTAMDDTSSFVTYTGSSWNQPTTSDSYYNSTAHVTSSIGDSVQLKFNGSSIQVYGGLYKDHGNYSVTIDGAKTQNFNGTFFDLQTKVSLYQANNLDDGPHTILLTNLGQGEAGNYFDFDYAVVNSTIDPTSTGDDTDTGTNLTGTSTTTSKSSSGSGNNVPTIAGGVVGGVVGLALVAVLAWFLFRRSNRARAPDSPYMRPGRLGTTMDLNDPEIKPFRDTEAALVSPTHTNTWMSGTAPSSASFFGWHSPGGAASNVHPGTDSQSTGTRQMSQESHTPFLTGLPPPPPSNATSYPRSVNPPSTTENVPLLPLSVLPNEAGTFGQAREYVPTSSNESQRTATKSAGVALPYTARPLSQPHVGPRSNGTDRDRDGSELSISRMFVSGREQDMGPAVPRSPDYETLPPDYHQATEPLPGQRRER